jgi:predicted amidohydrolase YtcJ
MLPILFLIAVPLWSQPADLVLLSDDIMTIAPARILKTRVLATMVGGEIVYDGRN